MAANDGFSEDVGRKARWFYEIRGKQSSVELNKRWHRALAQTTVLRASHIADHDPGGARIVKVFSLRGSAGLQACRTRRT
jgi:hypothetical protein